MRPRDLFRNGLESNVVPTLEAHGFRYRRAANTFRRDLPTGVRQSIAFQLSRWNAQDSCEFWSSWGTSAPRYGEWLKEHWNTAPDSDALAGAVEWNIPGWSRGPDRHFALRNGPADADNWREFCENVEQVGLPFLEAISSWSGAAAQLRSERWRFDRAADLLVIAGEREQACALLREGISVFETGRVDALGELPRLRERLERYSRPDESAV